MLTLANAGHCPLTISAITSSAPEFVVPEVLSFPLMIAPGGDLELTVRFAPTAFGPATGTITIASDDPASPLALALRGNTPSGTLTVSGNLDFGSCELGHHHVRIVGICNTGQCDLHVTRVGFLASCGCRAGDCSHRGGGCGCGCGCSGCGCEGHHHGHEHHHHHERHHGEHHDHEHQLSQCCLDFRIEGNPFPATLRPGSCMNLVVEYAASCRSEACCELVIDCDDPEDSKRILFATGRLRNTLSSRMKCWLADELRDLLREGGR
jgi:hypothetical protein